MALLIGYSANASAVELPGTKIANTAVDLETPELANLHSEQLFPTLRATILFFLLARAVRTAFYVVYGAYLPKFKKPMYWSAIGMSQFCSV